MAVFIAKVFSNPITDKLGDERFLPWQQLALASIKGQNFEDHLTKIKFHKNLKIIKNEIFLRTEGVF